MWTEPDVLSYFVQDLFRRVREMPGREYEKATELAADQHGYLTTAQALELGISRDTLRKMAKRGALERVSWGVYRVPTFPLSPLGQYMEACLWPAGPVGVISHQSALAIRDLSDVNPAKVHVTLPESFRVRRKIPGYLLIHHADLSEEEIGSHEGIPATTVRRTVEDCFRAHLGPALLRQAIEDGERLGYLRSEEARELERLVLP
jgi:predicted transcriptional regulator of viral defense system